MGKHLFAALLPLMVFWVVEEFWGLKQALILGCALGAIELTYEKIKHGKVSFLTGASNALILGLGAISFFMESGVAFKLQPMVMELGMAAMMLVMRFTRTREPFMLMTLKSAAVPDLERRDAMLKLDWFTVKIRALDTRMILFLTFHGLAVGWAAVWGTSRQWILLKGVLFYVLLVVVMAPMYKRGRGSTEVAK